MQIRQAIENDVESLVDLWIELMEVHAAFSTQFLINKNKRAAIEAFILQQLGKKQTRIFVMEEDAAIVAMLFARIEQRPEMFIRQRSGYIAETIVTRSQRGKNIGNELAEAAHAWFAAEGVTCSELQVAASNAAAIAFWQSKGYETLILRMIRTEGKT